MMYYRRKILLALLELFEGQLTATSLQKYLFLFTRSQVNKAFDFIPYKFGCYSFQANQDLSTMQKYGYVEIQEQTNTKNIVLRKSENFLAMLDLFDRQLMHDIKLNFGSFSQNDLIRYTYRKFPYYATKSTIARDLLSSEEYETVQKQKRHFTEPQIFSIGYEGLSLEMYINKLIINDVRVLCDVRKNAYSQKYGFSKSQLQKACEGVDIRYIHIPDLGIESEQRQELRSQTDYDILFEKYENTTLKRNNHALLQLKNIIDQDNRVAVTCFEKNTQQCHRTRVINAILELPNINYNSKNL